MVDRERQEPSESRAGARETATSWRAPAIAIALFCCFWAAASAAQWFVDKPFYYQGRANWVNNLSASGTRFLPQSESMFTLAAMFFLLPAIVVAAVHLARRHEDDPLEWWFRRPDAERTVVVLSITIAVALAAFVAFALVREADILDDERAYLFQARLFAQGKVGLPSPPGALRNPMILLTPMWTSRYPPGHSLLLSIGSLIHNERLVPPLLAGVLVLSIWSFARDAFGPKHGALAAVLAGASPFVWAMHGTAMAFSTSATGAAVFLAAIARAERTGKSAWMLLAGAAIGLSFITRPYEALAFAAPFAIRLLYEARKGEGGTRARLAWCVLTFVAVASLLPIHDKLVMGSWWRMPWTAPGAPNFRVGFTKSIDFGELTHTPLQAIGNLVGVIARLDLWALGWPCSLLLVVAGLLRRNATRWDRMLRWALVSYVAFYLLVPFPGTWDVGPTYYYGLLAILVPLAVRGVSSLRDRAVESQTATRAIGWVALLGIAVSVLAVFPMRAISLTMLCTEIRAPWETIEASNIGPAIVIVPPIEQRRAPGWAHGHPFTLTTARGDRVDLISPASDQEMREAIAFLGKKPLYVLVLDMQTFRATGSRQFALMPMGSPSEAANPVKN